MHKLLFLLCLFTAFSLSAAEVEGTRDLPPAYTAGTTITVTIDLSITIAPSGIIIYEHIPSGWTVTSASPTYSNVDNSTIKWLLYGADVHSRTISYTLSIPSNTGGIRTFSGEILYNDSSNQNQTQPITGDAVIPDSAATSVVTGARTLPAEGECNTILDVSLAISVASPPPNGLIVKDYIPSGWTVTNSSPQGTWDQGSHLIKWVFSGAEVKSRTIQYSVQVPASDEGTASFQGELLYTENSTEQTVPIIGDQSTTVTCLDECDMTAVTFGSNAFVVPASAYATGASDSNWKTDLSLYNYSSITANLDLYYFKQGKDNTYACHAFVALVPGQSFELNNVVKNSLRSDGAGAIFISANTPRLIVSSRTFNDQPLGTYGQFVPGHFYTDAIQYNEKATLIQLRQDNEYRTNVGFANVSDIAIDCIGDIYTSDGVYHGDFLVHLQPYMHAQIPGILSVMGLVPVQNAYIKVRTTTQNGKFFAYASTIDGRTGDGVYKPAVK